MDNYNPYVILKIPYSASPADIKSAYKRMAQTYHPDKQNGDIKKFLEIKKAYDYLIDPITRQKIDIGILQRKNLINLKNNTINYNQLISVLSQLEIETQNVSNKSVNKELLGEYLIWLFDENRIYYSINNISKNEKDHLVQKLTNLLNYAPIKLQIEFYKNLKHLNTVSEHHLLQDNIIDKRIIILTRLLSYNKYRVLLLIVTSIFLCFIIYFSSK